MKTARASSNRRLPHGYSHWRATGEMTPLPPERASPRRFDPQLDWYAWRPRELHPEFYAPMRQFAVLILWLLGVLAMIVLFAEFWP